MTDSVQKYYDLFISMTLQYIPQVALALFTLIIGFWVVRIVMRGMHRALSLQRIDRSLASFLESSVSIMLKILVIISVATMVGIQMTSFIAILGAASFALGLSLQGSLSNLSGGILILFFKPFLIGEEITAMGQRGRVEKIEMFSTILHAEGGETIILPNGPLSNGVVINYSRKDR